VRYRLTTLAEPHLFLPPETDEAHYTGEANRGLTCPDSQEAHREEEIPVGDQGEEGQHDEPLQGQEYR